MGEEYQAKMRLMGLQMSLEFTYTHESLFRIENKDYDIEAHRAAIRRDIEKQKKIVAKLDTGEYP